MPLSVDEQRLYEAESSCVAGDYRAAIDGYQSVQASAKRTALKTGNRPVAHGSIQNPLPRDVLRYSAQGVPEDASKHSRW